ncbi:MAG: hypothetical protein A2X67_09210 [Ignavibacteria bacterium GWA2_55_11]|nr:MAG: hypothetical protein A2X67_09210 [Ignavibacteria bacterium GWA2_55_11]OGU47589.1 MAG: hypothetical protein A2X68_06010 [Ignavibacteria bacterium GWC2_56_12]OGU62135.1 MAG: hypothetical protein A3C56_03105 [Ignavibacteria bacterium RIFCSPHIGHO2_02_FULL_56_12]OGU70623.1 MAG: hypothetical protein A3H45_02985 [Ignavibacteria bacterium RIFCSPLOWO2_02_FULL_55_14]OGU73378.1 MAG: hypothetical protein A3G43_04820 [Ignavibacteria bacterium RIFCSPLOWO2_12_FULL_56_21]
MIHRRQVVYLSGGMQYAPGGGASWRSTFRAWAEEALGHRVIDPVKESNKLMVRWRKKGRVLRGSDRVGGDWPKFFRTIVDRDVDLVINRSDYVVCLWNSGARRGAGTQGELTVARMSRKPVYVVSRTNRTNLPGWVQGCLTEHFSNFADLQDFLVNQYNHSSKLGARS